MNGSPGGESQPHNFELPQPTSNELDKNPDSALELEPLQESGPSKEGAIAPMPALPAIPTADPITIPVIADDSSTLATQSTTYSNTDTDRIEKEWIDKAKAIVAKTQDDPYEQKKEMSKVKAEYIKKRFNKSIPTDDTVKV